jgi:uncharacterized protein
MKKLFLIIIVLMILAISVQAKTGSMKLLAVSEDADGNYEGMLADLTLEIKPGTGRVFIDTFPITKLDTQLTTRYSKEVACRYLNMDCDSYDFFYHVVSPSSIIGGPSAGAATTALTIGLLGDYELNSNVAITGTINSGELVGPVGGHYEKISAAAQQGFAKALIAKGSIIEKDNETYDLEYFKTNWGIEVVEVLNIEQVMAEFTDTAFVKSNVTVKLAPNYEKVIRELAEDLCDRSQTLIKEINSARLEYSIKLNDDQLALEESAYNSLDSAEKAFGEDKFYSTASFCFGADVNLQIINVLQRNLTLEKKENLLKKTYSNLEELEIYMSTYSLKTMTDLQAYMIVRDRVLEAKDLLESAREKINVTDSFSYNMAFGIERIYSAYSWAKFLGTGKKELNFDGQQLKDTCYNKIAEAEERFQYSSLFFPYALTETKKDLDAAKKDFVQENYVLCLFKATKAKAQSNVILSSLGVRKEIINITVGNKLDAAKKLISAQTENEIFPILGFSYYEYGQSLYDEGDVSSSLLYAEYALELSDLEIYFRSPKEKTFKFDFTKYWIYVLLVIAGFIIGVIVTLFDQKGRRRIYVRLK